MGYLCAAGVLTPAAAREEPVSVLVALYEHRMRYEATQRLVQLDDMQQSLGLLFGGEAVKNSYSAHIAQLGQAAGQAVSLASADGEAGYTNGTSNAPSVIEL